MEYSLRSAQPVALNVSEYSAVLSAPGTIPSYTSHSGAVSRPLMGEAARPLYNDSAQITLETPAEPEQEKGRGNETD